MLGRSTTGWAAALFGALAAAATEPETISPQRFAALAGGPWHEALYDPGTNDWTRHWFLDGERATVRNTPIGMEMRAGPEAGNDACHAVLWSRDAFAGDLKIAYEFTRLDQATEFVNILYVQATGSGEGPHAEDIAAWRDLRAVPAMAIYYNHVHTYHISYAAFDHGNTDPANDYIRARRYLPESGNGLDGTALEPSYDRTGLFAPGVPHQMTVLKIGQELMLQVRGGDKTTFCRWRNDRLSPIESGRIGLRQMYTRDARYRDIRIWVRPTASPSTSAEDARPPSLSSSLVAKEW